MRLTLAGLLLSAVAAFGQDPQTETVYQVMDQMGSVILETGDSNLVKQFNHVKVKAVSKPVKLVTLGNDSTADDLKYILEKRLGPPERVLTYYSITWRTPNGGTLTLNKHPTVPKAVVIFSYKAQQWARDSIPAFRDDLREKPKEKHEKELPTLHPLNDNTF